MTISLAPTENNAIKALTQFLTAILPAGTPVVRGQANRVPAPAKPDYVIMTPIRRTRLATNVDEFVDTKITASIAGTVLTVTSVAYGALKDGSVLFGTGVLEGTAVVSQISGSPAGGVGSYRINKTQTALSATMAAGVLDAMQPIELTVQLDVHGPNGGDNATRATTMLRDDYAFEAFKGYALGAMPLTAEDRGQIPFVDGEMQYEDRWVVEAYLQVNATVEDIPQQFFEEIVVRFIPADIVEPA